LVEVIVVLPANAPFLPDERDRTRDEAIRHLSGHGIMERTVGAMHGHPGHCGDRAEPAA